MPGFCLLPNHAKLLAEKIRSGALDANALLKMGSEGRRAAFADIVGDGAAQQVNAAFESKMLLKHQQDGIARWVNSLDQVKPEIQRDLLARVQRMDRVLEPQEMQGFLADLAQQKLGFRVSMSEAAKLTDLAKAVSTAKTAGDGEAYVAARMAFKEYADGLSHPPLGIRGGLIEANRAFALSWPTTVVKLLGAWSNVPLSVATDVVAHGVTKAFPDFSEGVGRFGATDTGTLIQSQAAGLTSMWTDGMIDMGRQLLNKPSNLDLLHADRPAVRAWYEYSGSVHAALKAPVKSFEYGRALYRYTAESIRNGEDPQDLTVMMRNSTKAYKDANRFIFQEDNLAAKTWNAAIRRLEQVDKETGKPNPAGVIVSTAMQLDQPIVKTPANILADASEHIGGLLIGPSRVAWNAARGIEGLTPVERNAVIRQISKGTVGAALMTLYYFKRDQIEMGGFHQEGEHRKPTDVQAMGMRIAGHDVPKQLLHNALIYPLQYAATMGHVLDTEKQRTGEVDADGLRSATQAATLGLINEAPVIGQLTKDVRDILGPKTVDEFIAKKAANMVTPGALQWVAKATDSAPQRFPKGVVQHIEANIPGLRQQVPERKQRK